MAKNKLSLGFGKRKGEPMGTFITIIVIAIVIYFFVKSPKKNNQPKATVKSQTRKTTGPKKSKHEKDLDWLENRWKLANTHRQEGLTNVFPDWYFDKATERQIERLDELDIPLNARKISKGQASDLIGMHEPAEDKSLEILKFFKVSTRGLNQTKSRHEIALIFSDLSKVEAWNKRPPSQIQKEFFKFFGLKVEKGITHTKASMLISNHESILAEKEDPKLDEWEAFEEIIDEISDPDFREDYEIKKPSLTLIKSAITSLQKEGKSYRDATDNIGIVIDRMIELKPELQRG